MNIKQSFNDFYFNVKQTGMVLGALQLVLLFYLVVTGIILSFFYSTVPGEAYNSVVAITNNQVMSFVRNFHYWSADVLIFVLFLHITRVALTKPFGGSRRYAWWIGVGLVILVCAQMLIGTFLRGDQEAYEAYRHFFIGTNNIVAKYVPFFSVVAQFFSDQLALFRFFILHAVLLPLGIVLIIVIHGFLAPTFRALTKPIADATSLMPDDPLLSQKKFYQNPSMQKIFLLIFLSFFIIIFLSLTAPAPLCPAPFNNVEVTKPPWWLLWVVALENVWGMSPLVIAPPVMFFIFALVPLFTKSKMGADIGVYIYLFMIALIIILSAWAVYAPQMAHTEMFMAGQQTTSTSSAPIPTPTMSMPMP